MARLLHVAILTRFRLVAVLTLKDQRQRRLSSLTLFTEFPRLSIGGKREVVIPTFRDIFCTALRMAQHPILQDFVPYEAATSPRSSWIAPDSISIKNARVFGMLHLQPNGLSSAAPPNGTLRLKIDDPSSAG